MLCQNLSEVNRSCLLINRSRSAAAFEKVFTTNNHKLTVLKLVKKNLFENDGNICFNCLKTYYSLSSFSVFFVVFVYHCPRLGYSKAKQNIPQILLQVTYQVLPRIQVWSKTIFWLKFCLIYHTFWNFEKKKYSYLFSYYRFVYGDTILSWKCLAKPILHILFSDPLFFYQLSMQFQSF